MTGGCKCLWSSRSVGRVPTVYGCLSCSWSGNKYSLSPFAPDNLIYKTGFGCPDPRQPAHSPHPTCIWSFLTVCSISSNVSRRYPSPRRQPPSVQSLVNQAMYLRTDDVHGQVSTGTGSCLSNGCCLLSRTTARSSIQGDLYWGLVVFGLVMVV